VQPLWSSRSGTSVQGRRLSATSHRCVHGVNEEGSRHYAFEPQRVFRFASMAASQQTLCSSPRPGQCHCQGHRNTADVALVKPDHVIVPSMTQGQASVPVESSWSRAIHHRSGAARNQPIGRLMLILAGTALSLPGREYVFGQELTD